MRNFSAPARVSLLSRLTGEIWYAFLTLDVDGFIYHVVSNTKDPVTSNGQLYTPYPFDITLPGDSMESIDTVQITIDNVDLSLITALRQAQNPLKFNIKFALASQPNVIEMELTDLESDAVEFNANTITATLTVLDIWNAKFPSRGGIYDPIQCPALF
jgi:hypothetical protein